MVEEIGDDIFRLNVETPYREATVNVYLFLGDDGVDAIDIGPHSDAALGSLRRSFRYLNLDFGALKNIYLTHGHEDHGGLGQYFANNHLTKVHVHSSDVIFFKFYRGNRLRWRKLLGANLLRLGVPEHLLDKIYEYVRNSWPMYKSCFKNYRYLDGVPTIRAGDHELEVLSTPGHSPGSVCYYLKRDGRVFTGDTVLPAITANPGSVILMEMLLGIDFRENPLKDLFETAYKIRRIRATGMFPSHGDVGSGLDLAIERYVVHHNNRLGQIVRLLEAHRPSTCFDITRKIYDQFGDRDLLLQLLEVEAHLKFLEYKKRIKRASSKMKDGVYGWQALGTNQ